MGNDKKPVAAAPAPAQGGKEKAPKSAPVASAPVKEGCKANACKSKPTKFGFCADHYELYMAGVIRGDGALPIDYEQKLAWFKNQKQGRKAA